MTATLGHGPQWAPIDDDTASLLSLVADTNTPSPEFEWACWLAAVRTVAAPDGRVDPNRLRREVRGVVAPRRCGAFTNRALAAGLLVWRGDWVVSDDHAGRNGGKPCRKYVYTAEHRDGCTDRCLGYTHHLPNEAP